ncbi:MAG: ATP-binding protein [Acidimicrobiales bacterium]
MVIEVSDGGIGIPASDRERIFERFYRVDHADGRSTGGTGLGLSIVRHVAINHRGSVELESVEGERDPPSASSSRWRWSRRSLPSSEKAESMSLPSVLVVEDEEAFIDALTIGLEREGTEVRIARRRCRGDRRLR